MFDALNDHERSQVRAIGEAIGYGRTMQLCEQLWREKLTPHGMAGGEHATYCCASMLVSCPGCAEARERGDHCDWCCGAGRVTKRVAEAIEACQ